MTAGRYPRRIESVHVESIDGDLCVYDTARQHVHALNHTAAFVWQRCDGRTAPAELAAALSAEASIDDAEAVVQLTLQELAAAQLLAAPIDEVDRCRGATCSGAASRPPPSRRSTPSWRRLPWQRSRRRRRRADADERLAKSRNQGHTRWRSR